MRTWLIVALLLAPTAGVSIAQQTVEAEEDERSQVENPMRGLQRQAEELIESTRQLGNWDEHYGYFLDSIERVFDRNDWSSESDLYALELVREVGVIPPWQVQERYDAFEQMISDRYLLDEGQLAVLQQQIFKSSVSMFAKHSDRILQYAPEIIAARAAGEPFTPEQIARWTELAEPVFNDSRRMLNDATREFMEELDPEQRELVQADLDAANRRMGDVQRMIGGWKRGEWDPADWGMEDDPIQSKLVIPKRSEDGGADKNAVQREPHEQTEATDRDARRDERRQPSSRESEPDDPWADYVRAFVKKYSLSPEQQQKAWVIYHGSRERRDVFQRRYERQVTELRDRDTSSATALVDRQSAFQEELRRLFDQFKRRLHRLPTRAQRRDASPVDLPEPVAVPAPTADESKSP